MTIDILENIKKILEYFITHRRIATVVSVVMFVIFLLLIGLSGVELIPSMDQSMISITAELPIGSELEECEEIGDRIVAVITQTIPNEIKSISYSTGGSAILGGSSNTVSITAN